MANSSPSSSSSTSDASRLPAFLRQTKADIKAKFVDLEWQQRHRLLQGAQSPTSPNDTPSPWSRLPGDVVSTRNRYVNVEPFAQNRIHLQVVDGANDYINASPIQLGRRRYIATQGPKEVNVNHFYRMVAGEAKTTHPTVVVMLTQTHESGREKCFQYYPLSNAESPLTIPPDPGFHDDFHGEVRLQSVRDDPTTRSQLRTLQLRTSKAGSDPHEMEIQHLLFSGWPDFLVPEGDDRAALIELVRLSAELNHEREPAEMESTASTSNEQPDESSITARIIHCSAGVGRSGTFIALDYLLSLLHSGQLDHVPPDRDPIAETVDLLRKQRMMMVQGESQFLFLYDVMREQMLARVQKWEHGGERERIGVAL
ncbi:protein-tyrosine phosphatase-like protein [Neohortaea acidophila]|uniref:Protein-tyrosine phosphatase-like protein n=1 Tax=Neohortaea acidophila TaxID=245834 RepID=A0A6A6PN28_9PEZI|nr:protein-tyrosine phosphatase-like protein [Neohortaea acidophila]KAF2481469.1 protein-tyrosine phosphatase-like protein [Neohortaea acidophila]